MVRRKTYLAAVAAAALAIGDQSSAIPLPITNFSFEENILADGQSWTYANITAGWNRVDDPSRLWGTGVYNPLSQSPGYVYPGSNDNPAGGELEQADNPPGPGVPDGRNVAYIYTNNCAIWQQTSTNLSPGLTYTLTAALGDRPDDANTSTPIEILAGGDLSSATLLAEYIVPGATIPNNSFRDYSVSFGPNSPNYQSLVAAHAGKPLIIAFKANDPTLGETDIDNVRFSDSSVAGPPRWIGASGDWNSTANWSGAVPNGVDAVANFLGDITSPQTVYSNSTIVVGAINFDNASSYQIAGVGSLSIDVSTGTGLIAVAQGGHKINLPLFTKDSTSADVAGGATLTIGDPLTISAGTILSKTGGGTMRIISTVEGNGTLTLGAGALRIDYGIGAPATASAAAVAGPAIVANGGKLTLGAGQTTRGLSVLTGSAGDQEVDLAGNKLAIYAADRAGAETGIYNALKAARLSASGHDGIYDSTIPTINYAVGVTDQAVDAHGDRCVLVKRTILGDANVDGKVDVIDLGLLATGWQAGGKWDNGDSNFDDSIDVIDLGLLATNWQQSASGPTLSKALAAYGLPSVSVPEPASPGLIGLMIAGFTAAAGSSRKARAGFADGQPRRQRHPGSRWGVPAARALSAAGGLLAAGAVPCQAGYTNVTATAVPGSGGALTNNKAAWADYNNDGWADLNVSGSILRNNRNGTFTAVGGSGDCSIWGDYNNDGYVDLFQYVTGGLLRNNAGASFTSVSAPAAMPPVTRAATWGDFNRDGYLDLYVPGYENSSTGAYYADVIYTNNRNGTFTKTWTQGNDAVTTPGWPRPGRGVTAADWDQDGDLDVYVSYYRLEPNGLWRNNGSGTFTDAAAALNAQATSSGYYGGHSIGSAWGDFNNDGLVDLFAGNFAHSGQPQSRFLKNRGASGGYAFQDMGTGGVVYQESYASPTAGDIDNDGDLDLYFTTVYTTASGGVANYPSLFRNDGNFNFVDVTAAWGLPKTGAVSTYQAAFADYDNDGYLDLVTDGKIYHNAGGKNHYLKVRLDGHPTFDASATGAQVRISLNGQTLMRQVEGAVGEGNQNDPTMHFGLGGYKGPLTLQVRWPDGTTQNINVLSVDRTVIVARGAAPNTWVNTSGDWSDPSNWSTGSPNGVGAVASLTGTLSGRQTVYANAAVTLGSLRFDNADSYALAGQGSLTIDVASGSGSISVVRGSHIINLPIRIFDSTVADVAAGATLTIADPLTIAAGATLSKSGSGTLRIISMVDGAGGTLSVAAGAVQFAADQKLAAVDAVTDLAGDQEIDLGGKRLRIYADDPGAAERAIYNDIRSAAGSLTGRDGIHDSTSPGNRYAVGVTDGAIDANGSRYTLVMLAARGDANLDGVVDVADLALLAASWQERGMWDNGDFDYSGAVDVIDLGLLAANWQAGVASPLGPESLSRALAAYGLPAVGMPEPAGGLELILSTTGVMLFGARSSGSRRRRRES